MPDHLADDDGKRRDVPIQAARENRSERLDVRATAEVQQRTVGEFILQSTLTAAVETLAERQHFELDDKSWQAFL